MVDLSINQCRVLMNLIEQNYSDYAQVEEISTMVELSIAYRAIENEYESKISSKMEEEKSKLPDQAKDAAVVEPKKVVPKLSAEPNTSRGRPRKQKAEIN